MLFRSRTEILFIIMRRAAVPAEREGADRLTWFCAAAHIATFECGEQPSRHVGAMRKVRHAVANGSTFVKASARDKVATAIGLGPLSHCN